MKSWYEIGQGELALTTSALEVQERFDDLFGPSECFPDFQRGWLTTNPLRTFAITVSRSVIRASLRSFVTVPMEGIIVGLKFVPATFHEDRFILTSAWLEQPFRFLWHVWSEPGPLLAHPGQVYIVPNEDEPGLLTFTRKPDCLHIRLSNLALNLEVYDRLTQQVKITVLEN